MNGIHEYNKDLLISIEVFSDKMIKDPAVSFQIMNRDNIPVLHELNLNSENEFCQEGGNYRLISLIKNIKLYQGQYKLNVYFAENFSKITLDTLIGKCSFEIINENKRPFYWQLGSAIYKENNTKWKISRMDD